jgi:hypothetical protein
LTLTTHTSAFDESLILEYDLGFYHEITPGDVVIARRGLKSLAAIGDVASTAFYAPGKSPLHMHPSFMEIAWRNEPRNLNYPTLTFLRPTVVEISEKKYQKLRQSEASPPDALEPNDEIEDPNEFVLKKYLVVPEKFLFLCEERVHCVESCARIRQVLVRRSRKLAKNATEISPSAV